MDLVRRGVLSFVGISFRFISFRARRRRDACSIKTDESDCLIMNAMDDVDDARERRCRGYRNADDE